MLRPDDEEGVEGDAELVVVDVRDVLDVDADTDLSRLVLIGQVELGVVGRDADGLALGADLQLLVVHGKPFGGLEGLVVRVVHEGGDLKVGEGQEDQNLEHRWFFLDAEKRRKKLVQFFISEKQQQTFYG